MPIEGYVMGWRADVMRQRYHDYRAGLLDANEIALLYQDMIERECLPQACVQYAHHMVLMGLCRVPDAMPYN